jgi:hypothetical protein
MHNFMFYYDEHYGNINASLQLQLRTTILELLLPVFVYNLQKQCVTQNNKSNDTAVLENVQFLSKIESSLRASREFIE